MSARVGDVLSCGHGPEARLVMLAPGVAGSFQGGMPAHGALGTQLGEGHIAKVKRLTPERDTRDVYPGVHAVFRSVNRRAISPLPSQDSHQVPCSVRTTVSSASPHAIAGDLRRERRERTGRPLVGAGLVSADQIGGQHRRAPVGFFELRVDEPNAFEVGSADGADPDLSNEAGSRASR